jgi:hypothetical protein
MPHAHTEEQQAQRPLAQPLPEGEGICVTVSEKGFRRIRSLLALIEGRERAGAEEQIHNLRWMGHTPEKLPCVNWKS